MADQGSRTNRWTFWQRVIDDWQRSSLSVRAYCRENGLTEQSFYQWRRRLRASGADLPVVPGPFAPVRIQQQEQRVPSSEDSSNSIEIAFRDGRVVRVPEGVDPTTLATVVQVLEASRC